MSLLSKNEQIIAALAQEVDKIAANLIVAVKSANKLASDLLALSNFDLCEWLNSKPVEQRMGEFAAHALIGEYLNDSAEQVEIFSSLKIDRVDVRSFHEKLASQRRELTITADGFSIVDYSVIEPVIIETEPVVELLEE